MEELRSIYGKIYDVISKTSVPNPNYRKPRIKLYNVFTNEIINSGKGKFLEMYTLKSRHKKDILVLYINSGAKNIIKLPEGPSFSSN